MIDDDQDDRDIFREAVQRCNPAIETIFANDGVEALQLLNHSDIHPDAIFLDNNMPRMDGIQCLRKLKSNARTQSIPIVMYTTAGNAVQEQYVLSLGADYFLKKTNTFTQLCTELERLFLVIEKGEARHDLDASSDTLGENQFR